MTWYLYITESGEVTNSSNGKWLNIPAGMSQVLYNPAVPAPPWIYDGSTLRTPTQPELNAFTAARTEVEVIRSRASALIIVDKTDSDIGQISRASDLVFLDEINAVRRSVSLPNRNEAQINAAIKNKINTKQAD